MCMNLSIYLIYKKLVQLVHVVMSACFTGSACAPASHNAHQCAKEAL
jgi:hypothetical protein